MLADDGLEGGGEALGIGGEVGGGRHGDDGIGDGNVAATGLANDEGGEHGSAGVLREERGSGGKFRLVTEETDGRAGAGIRAIDEHRDEFVAPQGLDHFDKGERVAGADGDGLDAEPAAAGFAPAGERGAGLLKRDDGERQSAPGEDEPA